MARLFQPHVGGVEKHLDNICNQLKSKYEIVIVTTKHDKSLPGYEQINSIPVYRIENQNKLVVWKWFFSHLSLIIQADIIHIHDVFYWYLPFRFIFPKKKVYMTFHGYEIPGPPNKKQIFWHRLAAKLTNGNICIGDYHRKWYGVTPTFVSYGAA